MWRRVYKCRILPAAGKISRHDKNPKNEILCNVFYGSFKKCSTASRTLKSATLRCLRVNCRDDDSSTAAGYIKIKTCEMRTLHRLMQYTLALCYSPQILSFPSSHSFTCAVVTDFGLSSGRPSALSQIRLASTPNARLTAKRTV